MKLAVFQIVYNGEDGRGKSNVVQSYLSEIERDHHFNALGKNKNYYRQAELVLDLELQTKHLLGKLDGNDLLILRECLQFDKLTDNLSFPHGDINITCYEPKTINSKEAIQNVK